MIKDAHLLPLLNLKPTQNSILQHTLNFLAGNHYRIGDLVRESGLSVEDYKADLVNKGIDISLFEDDLERLTWERNILLGSDDFPNLSTNNGSTYAYTALENGMTNIKTTGGESVLKVYKTLTNNLGDYRGESMTYSVKVKNNKPDTLKLLNNGIGVNEYVGPNETTTVNHTGIISPTATPQIQFRSESVELDLDFDISPIMIVKGDEPETNWSPAPEDIRTKGLYLNENDNTIISVLPANYKNIINFRRASEQRLNDNGFFEIDVTEADVLDNDLQPEDLTKDGNKYIL